MSCRAYAERMKITVEAKVAATIRPPAVLVSAALAAASDVLGSQALQDAFMNAVLWCFVYREIMETALFSSKLRLAQVL